jgi:two-component sensor histidine kinase
MNWMPSAIFQPIRGTVPRYATAIVFTALGAVARFMADDLLPPGFPFLTFFPVVILGTFLAGRGPGIVIAVLSGLAAWFWFIPPVNSFHTDGQVLSALLFYAIVVAVDIALIDGLLQRQTKLVESQMKLAQMAESQTLLFKELQHRVANNLASISSMLRLQRSRIERDPASALTVVDNADARIDLMGRVHRQLYDPAARDIGLPEQFQNVVRQARDMAGASHVQVIVNAIDARISVDRMMTLMLLVTEVLTNSIKHAFEAGQPGQVRLTLERVQANTLRLTISDNGKGMADQPDSANGRPIGLGTMIIKGFAAQLGGTIKVDGRNGVKTVVVFPEDSA